MLLQLIDFANKDQTTSNNKAQNGLLKKKFINAIAGYQVKRINVPFLLA